MAIWPVDTSQDHDVYTFVYLLRDALRSALSDAGYLERTSLPKIEVKGAGHDVIAARLGRFRDGCMDFKEREALMLTKLLRARVWAGELRKLVPELQGEIDQFLEETSPCEDMSSGYVPDAQSMFNGGASLARFLSLRKPRMNSVQTGDSITESATYLVGGRKALYELRSACDLLLNLVEDEFFSSASAAHQRGTPVPGLLTGPEETPAPVETLN